MSILNKTKNKLLFSYEELNEVYGNTILKITQGEKVINLNKNNSLKDPKICIVYLASPREHKHTIGFMNYKKEVKKIKVLKESIKTTIEYLPSYPILIFHEDFTENDKKSISKIIKKNKIHFIKINFSQYKNKKNINEWMKKQKDFVEGRPAGYRMMCRFFSGVMQNRKELANFDYYIRMDHDSFFIKPKKLDVEKLIKKYNFDYLYRSIWTDHKEKKAIWEFTKKYAKENNLQLSGFKKLKMLNWKGEYNGRTPYNNFHISKISFWKREDVKKFLNEIEKTDGCIVRHWHDTNIHSMILGLFNATIIEKIDFGYKHNLHYSILGSLKIKYRAK